MCVLVCVYTPLYIQENYNKTKKVRKIFLICFLHVIAVPSAILATVLTDVKVLDKRNWSFM